MPKQITPGETSSITTADWQDTYHKPFTGVTTVLPDPQPAYYYEVDQSNNRIEVVTHSWISRGNYAYAAVGKTIEMAETNSERTAIFDFSGHLKAQAASVAGASAEVVISSFVIPATAGSDRPLSSPVTEEEMAKRTDDFVKFIYDEEDRTWSGSTIDTSIANLSAEDQKLEVYSGNLTGGNQYIVGLLVETSGGSGALGHATADAASADSIPYDFDGYVTYDTIDVSWT